MNYNSIHEDSQDSPGFGIHGFNMGKKRPEDSGFKDSTWSKRDQRIQDSRIQHGQKEARGFRIHRFNMVKKEDSQDSQRIHEDTFSK